jgi:hypothetical protein
LASGKNPGQEELPKNIPLLVLPVILPPVFIKRHVQGSDASDFSVPYSFTTAGLFVQPLISPPSIANIPVYGLPCMETAIPVVSVMPAL